VAVVTLVYDHHKHDLGHKLTHIQHDNLKVVVSTMHIHMDEVNCLEVLILKGRAASSSPPKGPVSNSSLP
jgi:CopG family nickel-responsive transcriptional regulator